MAKNQKIEVKGAVITLLVQNEMDFISLTDMTNNFKEGSGLIGNLSSIVKLKFRLT